MPAAQQNLAATGVWAAFADQCRRAGDRPAVHHADGSVLTYAGLETLVDPLRDALRRVPHGSVVALLTDEPFTALRGALAAGSVGCAFAPIDPSGPASRTRDLIEETGAAAVLSAENSGAVKVTIAPGGTNGRRNLPGIAYLLFTSGSTGRPKGVLVPDDALAQRFSGLAQLPGLGPDDTILALTHPTFDISIAETLLPLTLGAGIVMPPNRRARSDLSTMERLVAKLAPTVVQATPSWWRLALMSGWSTRIGRIWCGGEAMSQTMAAGLLGLTDELWNVYGPTEAAIWCSAARVEGADRIRLGEPIPGSTLDITASADGTGELVVRGAGLAAGYLDRAKETRRAFAFDEHGSPVSYRTGDLVRRHPDGSLEFVGRADRQIKLRGHRIELGEIEAVLESHPEVVECVVEAKLHHHVRTDPIPTLTAFVVARSSLGSAELVDWLAERLPAPLLPNQVTFLPALPRNLAGKVDRSELRHA